VELGPLSGKDGNRVKGYNDRGGLQALEREERLTRQEEITAEVVELAAGARARGRTRTVSE